MNKNSFILSFFFLSSELKFRVRAGRKRFLDVWPVNFLAGQDTDITDNTSLFLFQLACIVNMVKFLGRILRIGIVQLNSFEEIANSCSIYPTDLKHSKPATSAFPIKYTQYIQKEWMTLINVRSTSRYQVPGTFQVRSRYHATLTSPSQSIHTINSR